MNNIKQNKKVTDKSSTARAASESGALAKPSISKKTKTSIIAIAITSMLALGLILGLVLGLRDPWKRLNLDKMYIANFDSYVAIGAGTTASGAEGVAGAASSGDSGLHLITMNNNGQIQRARYKKHKNDKGEGKEIKYYLSSFYAFEKYTLVEFSKYEYGVYKTFRINNSRYKSYLIDNQTGRFYSLNIDGYDEFSIPSWTGYNEIASNIQEIAESETGIYLMAYYYNGNKSKSSIFKAYVQGDTLVLEEKAEVQNKVLGGYYFVDKFDNLYVSQYNGSYFHKDGFIINKEGEMSVFSDGSLALNGKVYVDNNKYYDENGQLQDGPTQSSTEYFYQDEIIKKEGNVWYCFDKYVDKTYEDDNNVFRSGCKVIKKVTWLDDENYSVEEVKVLFDDNPYAVTKDYIYFYKDQGIYRIDVMTGVRSEIQTDGKYFFKEIETDNLGNVLFKALDKFQQNISGVIDNEGNITVDVEERNFKVYYIKPLR